MRIGVWWASSLPALDPRAVLDERELARWSRYRQPADQARFVIGRLLARAAVSAELGCSPHDVRLNMRCSVCGGEHGKPQVAGADDLDLSIAHSHERVVVAVARGCRLGVDVEQIRPVEDLVESNHGVLCAEEAAALEATTERERAAAFLAYWTRKEALLKATGQGLTVPLDSLLVTPPEAPPAILDGPPSLPPEQVWMRNLDAGPGYTACLAALVPSPASEASADLMARHVTAGELARWSARWGVRGDFSA